MAKRKLAAVPTAAETQSFTTVFERFIVVLAEVHGDAVAQTYRSLREQEAAVVANAGIEFPDAADQLQQFLSFRIEE